MSIISAVYIRDGIILSSDSRGTHHRLINGVWETRTQDRAPKTFLLADINVGISYCGDMRVNEKLFHEFIAEFSKNEVASDDTALSVAEKLVEIIGFKTEVIVCGYVNDIPRVYVLLNNKIICQNENNGEIEYNALVRGKRSAPTEMYNKNHKGKLNYSEMTIEEGVFLAEKLVDCGIQNEESCGYPISTLVIKNNTAEWRRKMFLHQSI